MKTKVKAIILVGMLLASILFVAACGEKTPYDEYDEMGYNVSIKYDANGGMFTTNVGVITDSYDISDLKINADGKVELALISPDDERRGTGNYFTATNAGYFLAGWYTERTPVMNGAGEALDFEGKPVSETGNAPAYTYAGRWDFENGRMEIDPNATHTASEPITLYAAWIPQFKYEFYTVGTENLLGSYEFNPNTLSEIVMPSWNEETGKLTMNKFPTVSGMTLDAVYLDKNGEQQVEGETLKHSGSYDPETAAASNAVMKVYLEYIEGDWYRITTAEQFIDNATVSGCYEIMADLDFSEEIWKTAFIHGNFKGKIIGNGHTFKNITVEQTDARKQYAGLFGTLTDTAVIENLTFENVSVTLASGTLQQDAAFALFAGSIDASAKLDGVAIKNAVLVISSEANIPSDISIGLLCGIGDLHGVDISGITCRAAGNAPESIVITVDGNEVTVTLAP